MDSINGQQCAILGLAGFTRRTARFLADVLGIDYIGHPDREHYGLVIRWGNSEMGLSTDTVVNSRDAVRNAADKLRALNIMFKAEVSVPHYLCLTGDDSEDTLAALLPGFVRARYHRAGHHLEYCSDYYDFSGKMEGIKFSPDYIIKEILKVREYRVHVGKWHDIEMLYVQRKLRQTDGDDHQVWNYDNGWRFHTRPLHKVNKRVIQQAQKAREALGLDFGAVDIIQDTDGLAWVIEVNTAPGLQSTPSQEAYIKFFRGVLDNA